MRCAYPANVPGSVLWLFSRVAEAEANLRREAQTRGIESDRLIFAHLEPKPEHLARHQLADLFLDTLYYNAHTTGSKEYGKRNKKKDEDA